MDPYRLGDICDLIGFQVITVTVARCNVVGYVQELQIGCFDTHVVVTLFHHKSYRVIALVQAVEQILSDQVQIISTTVVT